MSHDHSSSQDPAGISRRLLLGSGAAAALGAAAVAVLDPFAGRAAAAPLNKMVVAAATAPVPPPAKGPAIPKAGYLVTEIAANTYVLTDGIYQMIFLTTQDGVVAIDAPPTLGNNITRGISSVTRSPIRHAIYSHHHADHIGAASLYKGATIYAHKDAARLVRSAHDPNRPTPKHTFSKSLDLNIGGERIQLDYHGTNHTPGNIFVYLPKKEVLMLVDVVFPGWVPFAYLAESQDVPGWLEAPAQALKYPFQTLVGGHLTRLGTRDDVVIQQAYAADLAAEAEKAIANFDITPIYSEVDPENTWAIFNGYLNALTDQVADAVTPRWTDKLGGADVYTQSNAYSVIESLRIDKGQLGPFGIHP
jgi:glyoxylase-like metal-dependent hydrolase (beta-lactamase superfamily II)